MSRKISIAFVCTVMALMMMAGGVYANEVKMEVNGKALEFNAGTPFVEAGRSLVPLRDLLISLGVSPGEIRWEQSTKTVTAKSGETTIQLAVGEKAIYNNGVLFQELEVPAQQVDGRVYLPARAVAEAFGYKVGFNSTTKSVTVEADTGEVDTGEAEPAAPTAPSDSTPQPEQDESAAAPSQSDPLDIISQEGAVVTLPEKAVGENQLYGLIYAVDAVSNSVTLVSADGTGEYRMSSSSTLIYSGGSQKTWSDHKEYVHHGVSALVTISADGQSIVSAEIGHIQFKATVQSVKQEIYPAVIDGVEQDMEFTFVTVDLGGGVSVELTSDKPLSVDLTAGDLVEITGTLVNGGGYLNTVVKK